MMRGYSFSMFLIRFSIKGLSSTPCLSCLTNFRSMSTFSRNFLFTSLSTNWAIVRSKTVLQSIIEVSLKSEYCLGEILISVLAGQVILRLITLLICEEAQTRKMMVFSWGVM
jgi:hypothetical protein